MMYKVCQIIVSTNRLEYLTQTLEAQVLLDTTGCDVHKIFVDDYPNERNDDTLRLLARNAGYHEIYLHDQNRGIGATWQELWTMIRDRDYDYVWHQEDDVVLLRPVMLLDLIAFFEHAQHVSQLVLKRQPWYAHETPSQAEPTDEVFRAFRGEKTAAQYYFSPIASLYPIERTRLDYAGWFRTHYPHEPIFHTANINEGLIGKVLLEGFGLTSMHVKHTDGTHLIQHIGVYTQGRKLLPGEPGYEAWAALDPDKRYLSGSGIEYTNENTNPPTK